MRCCVIVTHVKAGLSDAAVQPNDEGQRKWRVLVGYACMEWACISVCHQEKHVRACSDPL